MTKPVELLEAEIVDGLCRRWGQCPSQIMREDARYVLHTLALIEAAGEQQQTEE